MTLLERAHSFEQAFPKRPAAWARIVRERGREVLYATWLIGNDYRATSGFYGAYPPGYLDRVHVLFPDRRAEADAGALTTLHAFSGSLQPGPYLRCDSHQPAEFRCPIVEIASALFLEQHPASRLALAPGHLFNLVIADPPYTREDAVEYGTPPVDRGKVLRALASVTRAGGHVAWLDTVWPMHRKEEWATVGRITVIRSTNHRVRLLSIFERTA